jgi:hypothetical protein
MTNEKLSVVSSQLSVLAPQHLEQFALGCIPDCFPAHPERSRAGGEVEGVRASTSLRYAQPERYRTLDSYK